MLGDSSKTSHCSIQNRPLGSKQASTLDRVLAPLGDQYPSIGKEHIANIEQIVYSGFSLMTGVAPGEAPVCPTFESRS